MFLHNAKAFLFIYFWLCFLSWIFSWVLDVCAYVTQVFWLRNNNHSTVGGLTWYLPCWDSFPGLWEHFVLQGPEEAGVTRNCLANWNKHLQLHVWTKKCPQVHAVYQLVFCLKFDQGLSPCHLWTSLTFYWGHVCHCWPTIEPPEKTKLKWTEAK